ncbi:hypothetical protein KR093_000730 [Drosophila rubida]|uniref:Uncharacterized protein n=1 Tax=Drosophila rubida TaxID=30044 RepID=A0AAD4K364_9MUSC|nr:hypothetical protein KR093_000730 [Drosophila rubida]
MPLIQALPTPTPTPTPTRPPSSAQSPPQHLQQQQQHAKLAKSMPVTPIQPQSPTDSMAAQQHFMAMPRSPSYELYDETRPPPLFRHAHSHSDATFRPQHYDDDEEQDDGDDDDDLDEDTSSLAMITPPPPYDTPQLSLGAAASAAAAPPPPPPRKFRFGNRELFSMSPGTPSAKSNAITPTKLSAAAAAMFATPQMAQLNRKWAHLQRKRRRRNSSNGDSKELDKLVLQSVDWDENEMY